jgi:cysteinyl-tRNA synthetase
MSEKYLGKEFDIHGGGMDLLFPHHECEIAQNTASRGCSGVKYWMHNNMITIEGKKMGKSLGNFITLPELFAGRHEKLAQAYTPMTVRFFILQAHYRGTLDFSNEALQAAEKGLKRIMQAAKDLRALASAAGIKAAPALAYGEFVSAVAADQISASNAEVRALVEGVYEALCDDLNTPIALSHVFDAIRIINTAKDRKITLDATDYKALVDLFDNIVFGVLGLRDEDASEGGKALQTIDGLVNMVLEQRKAAKAAKDWATSDRIRDDLKALGIQIKDTKEGTEWTLE